MVLVVLPNLRRKRVDNICSLQYIVSMKYIKLTDYGSQSKSIVLINIDKIVKIEPKIGYSVLVLDGNTIHFSAAESISEIEKLILAE